MKLHTGSGGNTATEVYWGQSRHVWNNTGTENAYLKDTNGTEVAKKSCRYTTLARLASARGGQVEAKAGNRP